MMEFIGTKMDRFSKICQQVTEGEVSDSQIEGKLGKSVETLFEPIKKAGGADNFVASFAKDARDGKIPGMKKGKDPSVEDIIKRLKQIEKELQRKAGKELKETLERDYTEKLYERYSVRKVTTDMMLDEAFWSKVYDIVSWMGRTLKWLGEKFMLLVRKYAQSWFGKHPVGRIALGCLVIAITPSLTKFIGSLTWIFGVSIPWIVPTGIIAVTGLWIVTEAVRWATKVAAALSHSDISLSDVAASAKKDPLPLSSYFRGLSGMRV